MSQTSSFKPSFEALEARDVASVTTESLRIPDSSNPDVVAITRQTQYNLSTAITPQGTKDHFAFYNGGELLNMTGRALGLENTLGVGSEGSPETVRVTPSFTVQVIGNNQLRIAWANMKVGAAAGGPIGYMELDWIGRYGIWDPDGERTINVPNTSGDPRLGQIFFEMPGYSPYFTGLQYRIQGGRFTQNPPAGTHSFPGQFGWNRVLPNPDVDWLAARSLNTRNIASTTWATDEVFLHPEANKDMDMTWTSPAAGSVDIAMLLRDMQPAMGDGATYTLRKVPATGETTLLSSGLIQDGATVEIGRGVLVVQVAAGDKLQLTLNGRGTNNDAANVRGDMHKITFNPILTETEKTYEKVTVAPSIRLRANSENSALFVDFRNMPGDVTLRARARDHLQQTSEMQLPQGSGSKWINLNGMYPTDGPVPIDVYLLTAQSDGLPVQEKKLTFTAQLTNGNPVITQVPNVREYFGALANDVLRDVSASVTELDLEEQVAAVDYKTQSLLAPPVRDWTEGQTIDYYKQENDFGLHQFRWGPLVGNGGTYKTMYEIDTTKYHKFKVWGSETAEIVRPWYFVKNDMKKLPHEYWSMQADGSIIIKPNAPRFIILEVRLNGTFSGGRDGNAETINALLPIVGQHITGGIQQLQAQPADQQNVGFHRMITEFRDGRSPVLLPGTTVQVISQFQSVGTVGGRIILRTYCGYTGDVSRDPLQNTITLENFAVNGRHSAVYNAHAGTNPPTPESRAIITEEIEYADGRREILSQKKTRAATENAEDAAYRRKVMETEYLANLRQARADTVAYLLSIGQPIPPSQFDDFNTMSIATLRSALDGTGGSASIMNPNGAWQLPNQSQIPLALGWYDPNQPVPGMHPDHPISGNTIFGRILRGFLQKFNFAYLDGTLHQYVAVLSSLTGVGMERIMPITLLTSPATREAAIRNLFTEGQYGSAFTSEIPATGTTFAATNKFDGHTPNDPDIDVYRNFSKNNRAADMFVRVRFDVAPSAGMTSYDHANAYLVDAETGEQLGRLTPQSIKDGLFVSIPLSTFKQYTEHMMGGPDTDIRGGKFKIKFVTWFSSQSNAQGYPAYTNPFTVEYDWKNAIETPLGDRDLSLLPTSSQLRNAEVEYLKRLHFPLEGNGWYYGLLSDYHDGAGLYALDFNGDNDFGKPVTAPISGKVTKIDLIAGQISLQTQMPDGKKVNTTLLHMINILEAKTGMQYEGIGEAMNRLGLRSKYSLTGATTHALYQSVLAHPAALAELQPTIDRIGVVQAHLNTLVQNGLLLSAKELIGAVGNEQHSTGAHLHMQSDVEGNPVNLFAWADAHRNGILAQSDVQNLYFKFNAELGVLVNQDNKLILQRKVEGNEGVSRVYVWTAGFNKDSSATQEEVVWKKKKFVDANGVLQDAFTWVKKTDENYRWDAALQDFIPLLPS